MSGWGGWSIKDVGNTNPYTNKDEAQRVLLDHVIWLKRCVECPPSIEDISFQIVALQCVLNLLKDEEL